MLLRITVRTNSNLRRTTSNEEKSIRVLATIDHIVLNGQNTPLMMGKLNKGFRTIQKIRNVPMRGVKSVPKRT